MKGGREEFFLAQADNQDVRKVAYQQPTGAKGKKPNIVMLMTDDTGWSDFGCYSGGGRASAIRHPISIA